MEKAAEFILLILLMGASNNQINSPLLTELSQDGLACEQVILETFQDRHPTEEALSVLVYQETETDPNGTTFFHSIVETSNGYLLLDFRGHLPCDNLHMIDEAFLTKE